MSPFSNTNPPVRDGDYTRFLRTKQVSLPGAPTSDIVAMPIVEDWGPLKEPVTCNGFEEYLAIFGSPLDPAAPSAGYIAAYNLFKGEGGRPGASTVLFYRMGAPVAGSVTLAAGATDPALVLTAVYKGPRGNNLKVEVVANASAPSTQVNVNIYDGSTLVESYKGYSASQLVQLEADINARSGWVIASGAVNGTLLDTVAAQALAGGSAGPALASADWIDAMTVLEPQRFGYFVPYDLTDASIIASLATWGRNLNHAEKAKRFFLAFGGVLGESFSAAALRTSTLNDENIVNVGAGTYHDEVLDLDLSTSQLAPRIVGVMAQRSDRAGLSFAHLADLTIVEGPSDSELASSLTSGVITLGLDSSGVRIERGVTTYTEDQVNQTDKPFETYSEVKYVTTMQDIERAARERNETGNQIGLLVVNKDTREHIVSDEQQDLDERVVRGALQRGAKAYIDPSVPVSDDDNFVAVAYEARFGRYLGQIRRSVYIG